MTRDALAVTGIAADTAYREPSARRGALLGSSAAIFYVLRSGAALIALTATAPAFAQAVEQVTDDIVITARKSSVDSTVQQAPFAVTAYGEQQLEALQFRGLETLNVAMPNVQFDAATNLPGTAVFSIRGLGLASSVPSLDPTVGVFVDGVYMGINAGVVVDNFDLEGIEVLRGPQGVLFGRNVTGGAILIRTRAPTDELEVRAHASVETGLRYRTDLSVSGPLGGGFSAKLAGLYDHDDGWFRNAFDDRSIGRTTQYIVRPALRFESGPLELTLRLEHGEINGDGPVGFNSGSDRPKFFINSDYVGYAHTNWDQAFLEGGLHVPFGNGRISSITGWRRLQQTVSEDLDSLPIPTFVNNAFTDQHQFSEEVRYAGTFGPLSITLGGYYFDQHLDYVENRVLFSGAANSTGGGIGDFSTLGAFASGDYALTTNFVINLGLRYTREKKSAEVATIAPGTGSNFATRTLVPNFFSRKSWNDLGPRVGFQWQPSSETNLYGFWARGFRSGGYNFRNTTLNGVPGPTDPESMDSFELGLKQEFADRAGRINIALFHNTIRDVQRDISTVAPNGGPQQQTRNSGNVRIDGAELEVRYRPAHNLLLSGNVGYTHGKYTSLLFDLNGDGVINAADYGLSLTRLAPWSYGFSVIYDLGLGSAGTTSTRISYSHRDRTFIYDNNSVVLPKFEMIDVNLSFTPRESRFSFSIYGTNLLNRQNYTGAILFADIAPFGGDNNPATPAPQYQAINRGRVLGIDIRFAL